MCQERTGVVRCCEHRANSLWHVILSVTLWHFYEYICQLSFKRRIVAKWHHMASGILVNIGLGNVLWPARWYTITWTNDDIKSTGLLETSFSEICIKNNNPIQENRFTNAVCKITTILFSLQINNMSFKLQNSIDHVDFLMCLWIRLAI